MKSHSVTIAVHELSKKFSLDLKRSLWYGVKDLTRELLFQNSGRPVLRKREFWALRDISFEVHQGETLGIVGHNGAGKSTLLKLINGLIKPDVGRIHISGRIGALIELGMGFSPILTGRENIFVNAAILGISGSEVEQIFPDIVEFAELGGFIDTPVQMYSTGMRVRLGFAIASHMNPDILLVDEVLSVGDSSFRERSYRKLAEFKRQGGTILFVSHNSTAVEAVSDRVMMMDHGQIVELGDPSSVIQRYEQRMLALSREAGKRSNDKSSVGSEDAIQITAVECRDLEGSVRSEFEFGESLEIHVYFELNEQVRDSYFTIAIKKGSGGDDFISGMHMAWDNVNVNMVSDRGIVGCTLRAPPFSPGYYQLRVGVQGEISGQLGQKWHAHPRDIGSFTVLPDGLREQLPGAFSQSLVSGMPPVVVDHQWKLDGHLMQ